MMSVWQRVKDVAAFVVVGLIGVAAALVLTFLKIIPDQEKKKREEAKKKADAIKAELEKNRAARAVKVDQAVAVVKEEEKTLAKQDSVDVANQFILDELKKG